MWIDTMWIFSSVFWLHFLTAGASLQDSFENADSPTRLELKAAVKLSVGTRVRDNLGKVLKELPVNSYELHHSIKLIGDYLKNGGSLLDCIDVICTLAYLPFQEQLDGILRSMEETLPRQLMPAISFVRREVSSSSNATSQLVDVFRPNFGPLKIDLFEKVSPRELKEAALPLVHRQIYVSDGPWPKLVGHVTALMAQKLIPVRPQLVAHVLANLRIPDGTPETREAIRKFVKFFENLTVRELQNLELPPEPHDFVRSIISATTANYEHMFPADGALAYLTNPKECRKSPQLHSVFQDDELDYAQLIAHAKKIIPPTFVDSAMSLINSKEYIDFKTIMEDFYPFEYTNVEDQLLALVGTLRRHTGGLNFTSDMPMNAYGALLKRQFNQMGRHYGMLRSVATARGLLLLMRKEEESMMVRRLLTDAAFDLRNVDPILWKKAQATNLAIPGPTEALLSTLQGLLDVGVAQGRLRENVKALLSVFRERSQSCESNCFNALKAQFASVTTSVASDSQPRRFEDVDLDDLLQVFRDLDVYSEDYKTISQYLLQDVPHDIVTSFNITQHPTRARLTAWIMQKLEYSNYMNNEIHPLARKLMGTIAYEGYGAGRVMFHSSS